MRWTRKHCTQCQEQARLLREIRDELRRARAAVKVNADGRTKLTEQDGHEIRRELRRLARGDGMASA